MQFWTTTVARSARGAARTAQEIEAAGWDGMLVVDSQNLSGDPYVSLALAATATTRIGLGTGVTNSVTRHAAATATAITSRSTASPTAAPCWASAAAIPRSPISAARRRGSAQFERYLRQLQAYLRRRVGELRRDRHPARGGAADVGAAPARRAARQPHRLDRRRPRGRAGRQGAGRGRGQRPQGDRHVGAACRAGDVHAGRRRRAAGLGHRAGEEDAQGRRPRSRRASPSAPTSIWAATPTSARRAAWCAAASRPSRASR